MTPVVYLSDAFLANGTEPWRIPDLADLPDLHVPNRTEQAGFYPYLRDDETLARPWVVPGTPGLEHRIGGLEKLDVLGTVSYDPDNHHRMTLLRAEKVARIARDIPPLEVFGPPEGDLLILGWGSTYGAIRSAVERLQARGKRVAHAHLRHLNPFPANTGDVLRSYRRVLVPEINLGQLRILIAGPLPRRRGGLQPGARQAVPDRRDRGARPSGCSATSEAGPMTDQTTTARRGRAGLTRGRTSPATRSRAGAPAAATTRSWPRPRRSCPTSASRRRTSSSSPGSAAPAASRTT